MSEVGHDAVGHGMVVHGGVQREELEGLGIDPIDVYDLSANLNPFGPHSHVLLAARDADIRRYPAADAGPLRDGIAHASGLASEQVLVTSGATAAIFLAARALLQPGDDCALWPPAFGEYAAAIEAVGAHAVEYRSEAPGFAVDLDVAPAIAGYLCNPNNPSGAYLERSEVERVIERLGGTLILDVAYDAFVDDAWDADDLVRAGLQVLVIHSLTKLHAAPGIRVGYVVGAPELVARLARLQPSWPIDAAGMAAGLAMLSVETQQRRARTEVTRVRALMVERLSAGGAEVSPGRANFILVRVGDAAAFRTRLLMRGFAVRDCASFGLPEWVRVAVPVEAAADRLIPAFLACLEAGAGA